MKLVAPRTVELGRCSFDLLADGDGAVRGIGAIRIAGVPIRGEGLAMWPWIDTFGGHVFSDCRLGAIEQSDRRLLIQTRIRADADTMFREQRDSSGDLCFRRGGGGRPGPEAELDLVIEPAKADVGGLSLEGFRYHFRYRGADQPIHRLIDRQSWEPGGRLDGNTLCLRNWLTAPRVRLSRNRAHSTVGNGKWSHLLPGNMWARWSLLPAFDMLYGSAGVLLTWFDRLCLIRSVIETDADEDHLRVVDMHLFPSASQVATVPKTVLFHPGAIDDLEAVNLWTAVQDQEQRKAQAQLGIARHPRPTPILTHNAWVDLDFARTYEQSVHRASRIGASHVFIDPVWMNQEALRMAHVAARAALPQHEPILSRFWPQNMCVTLDFKVADEFGGEAGLKALCDRAASQGVKIISWMAAHMSPNARLQEDASLGIGQAGIFAAGESGRHPATGYPASCWPLNLHAPIRQYLEDALLGVCRRTGLAGFLWDSFCNLGWWQIDYSSGTMAPQCEIMGRLYASLVNQGCYIAPEALVTFSSTSCCGMHGGEIYDGEQLPFAYRSSIPFWLPDAEGEHSYERRLVAGRDSIDRLYRSLAHERCPMLSLGGDAIDEDPDAVASIRQLLLAYRRVSPFMQQRTVLPDGRGVLWQRDDDAAVMFCFADQPADGPWQDAVDPADAPASRLTAGRIYLRPPRPVIRATEPHRARPRSASATVAP